MQLLLFQSFTDYMGRKYKANAHVAYSHSYINYVTDTRDKMGVRPMIWIDIDN